MKVKVKLINSDKELPVVPFKTYDKDYCYDVTATSEEEIAPNVWKYGIGLAFQISRKGIQIDNDILFSIDFRPRSSIWKTGMALSNSVGTIDELFNGEISAVFYHIMTDMPRYKVGDRIGQIKLGHSTKVYFEVVQELDNTDRNSGSYGSTGK